MNLLIGDTSQLSFYFPEEFDRISSRNINYDNIIKKKYDKIFILFAEQRTFLNESEDFFTNVNVKYTLSVIDKIKDYCNQIIIYSTSELWNSYDGEVSVDMKYNYGYSPYIKSKEILSNYINEYRDKYHNITIIYPFNFNSPNRNGGFLFGKIFESIIKKEKISVGNLNFYRDLIHPSIIVKNSLTTQKDLLIGSGELISIQKFIKDLYTISNLNYIDYISFNETNNLQNIRKNYFSKIKYSNYEELLNLTYYDTKKYNIS
jgi:nucleoside-diphosphate-sugar epimerase